MDDPGLFGRRGGGFMDAVAVRQEGVEMKSYEQSCADVLELIQQLCEEESIKLDSNIAMVHSQVSVDNEYQLFVQVNDGITVQVQVG
jgi:hypothetical protein